jgi:hypothetical protein
MLLLFPVRDVTILREMPGEWEVQVEHDEPTSDDLRGPSGALMEPTTVSADSEELSCRTEAK